MNAVKVITYTHVITMAITSSIIIAMQHRKFIFLMDFHILERDANSFLWLKIHKQKLKFRLLNRRNSYYAFSQFDIC